MNVLFVRFSHLSERILNCLKNEDLGKCREVCKSWQFYLDEAKFLDIRKIKAKITKFHEIGDEWKRVFEAANADTIKKLHKRVDNAYAAVDAGNCSYLKGTTPSHVAANVGDLSLFEAINEKAENLNPRNDAGITPLQYAASKGHLKVCEYIMRNLVDKNPRCNVGWTPLHAAAKSGDLNVLELIIKQVEDKNPGTVGTVIMYKVTRNSLPPSKN